MVDAYRDITIPFHMSTKEFFNQTREHLNKGDVLMININMRTNKNTEITDYLTQTVKSNMSKVYNCVVSNSTNTIAFASDDENCKQNFLDNIKSITTENPLNGVSKYVSDNLSEVTETKYVFTDDIAPVEIMGQRVLDEIVSDSLSELKQNIKNSDKGIWGIFDMLSGG